MSALISDPFLQPLASRNAAGRNAKHRVETHSQRFLFSSCSFFSRSTCLSLLNIQSGSAPRRQFFFSSFFINTYLFHSLVPPFTFFFASLMYSTQQCSHAVSCLVINLLNFIRNGRGGMGMERSKRKEKKTKSEGDSFHWLVRTIGSTRLFAACDARSHNHPPFTYYTMAFPFFSLSFACCSITDLSTWIWFRREEEEGKKNDYK